WLLKPGRVPQVARGGRYPGAPMGSLPETLLWLAVAAAGALPLAGFAWLLRRGAPPPLPPQPAPPAAPPPAGVEPVGLAVRLARTREALLGRIGSVFGERRLDAALGAELEALLFGADLGVATAEDLLARVRREAPGGDAAQVRAVLRQAIAEK